MRAWNLQDCIFVFVGFSVFPLSQFSQFGSKHSFLNSRTTTSQIPVCLPTWIRLGIFENKWKPFANNCTVAMLIVCRWLYRSSGITRYYGRSNKRSTWASTSRAHTAGSQSWRLFFSKAYATRSRHWLWDRRALEASRRRKHRRRLCLLLRHLARLHSLQKLHILTRSRLHIMSTCRFPNRIAEFQGCMMWVLCGSFKEPGQLQSSPEAIIFRHFSRDRLKSSPRPQPLRHDPLILSLSLFRLKNPPASPDIIPSISFNSRHLLKIQLRHLLTWSLRCQRAGKTPTAKGAGGMGETCG